MISVFEWATRKFPQGGFFVEAGAHDGVGDSQTLELGRAGWSGLCVEPSSAFAGLARNRKCKVDNSVLGEKDGLRLTFRELLGNAVELSGLVDCFGDHWDRDGRPHADRLVETVSLTTLLERHGAPPVVELLCLDTEGSELAILRGHDFARFRFLLIQVEHNGVAKRMIELSELLIPKGYFLVGGDGINDRYKWNANEG